MPLNSLSPSNFSEFGLQEFIDNRAIEECREILHSNHRQSNPQVNTTKDDNVEGGSSGKDEHFSRGRIAFITKSDIDNLEDGYKWRKYGRKKVKGSPNPRNYYRCTSGGCNVKKRIERMREDSSCVLTTYEGIHSHLAPYTETTQPPTMVVAASSIMAALNGLNW